MSRVNSFLLAAVLVLTAFFIISCTSMEGIRDFSKNGIDTVSQGAESFSNNIKQQFASFQQRPNFSKAKRLDKQASERRQKYGDEDEQALNLYNQAIDEYRKCVTVSNGNTGEAYHNLGKILYTGPESLRNYSEAAQYLNEAAEIYEKQKKKATILSAAYSDAGTAQYRSGDYNASFNNFKKASDLSSEYSVIEARFLWLGLGVKQDLPKAMDVLKGAALAGRDVWTDIYALDYQIQQGQKGNSRSQGMSLYMDYLKAKTMGESDAAQILTKSADSGWPPAQEELWSAYRQSKDYAKGMPYLQKAAAANFIPAFFEMGYMYDAGLNAKVDYAQAAKWYEKAATEGHSLAQNNLGSLYSNDKIAAGNGSSNREMASYWFKLSAEQGNADAIKNQKQVAKQIKMENTVEILNALAAVTSATADIANALEPSAQPASPSASAQQTAQNNSSTSRNASASSNTGKKCPLCLGNGKCTYYIKNYTGVCNKGKLACMPCNGTGKDDKRGVCIHCHGAGFLVCTFCKGTGKCSRCGGKGVV